MTFIKFLIWKIKNTSSNYWMVLLLKIFIRIFGMLTFLSLLTGISFFDLTNRYNSIGSIFYVMFFVFLDSIIKVSPQFSLSEKLVKPLNALKWLPLLTVIYLIYLKIAINKAALYSVDFSSPAFLFKEIWPRVIIPNLGFIIITLVIFYTSGTLNRNKRLKEENDLTI